MQLSNHPLPTSPTSQALPAASAPQQDATAFSRHNALRRLVRCLFAEGILDQDWLKRRGLDL